MAEYIEREAATLAVCQEQETAYHRLIDGTHVTVFAFDVKKRIEKIPSADVAPVRHGRWFMRGGKWRCSECDQKALLRLSDATGGCREYEYYRANYCPNCGAKMDGDIG